MKICIGDIWKEEVTIKGIDEIDEFRLLKYKFLNELDNDFCCIILKYI